MKITPAIDELSRALSRLPGIGPRSARRISMHIISLGEEDATAIAKSIIEANKKVGKCKNCNFLAEEEICEICSSPTRDESIICVVEQPEDAVAIEASGFFRGYYHVLGGYISPVDGIGPDELTIGDLIDRASKEQLKELIIATNPTVEGEVTALYISNMLSGHDVRITRIARGMPMGGDIEYTDGATIGRAIEYRTDMDSRENE